ncbi:Signal transduction histidine kinase [Candidatus Burkholderia verschuerenii]|uniref:histidine kinase n=1 Tax=Candidatus Burkholderia verschuerenii TaxID=242163 RepID=A0A0L0MBW2_9BURK|nr:sensor histidine kinase [Candidatus Burkholderia verschuerenii]KND59459.1 Signal transduction histidine kinase [Candidatus Burkholderia verschuerenii]
MRKVWTARANDTRIVADATDIPRRWIARLLRSVCVATFQVDLRARLLCWLLIPLATFVLVTAWTSYEAARQTAGLMQDTALLSSARTIIEDIEWADGGLSATIPPAALELFASPYQDQVFYKVVTGRNRLLTGTPDLPTPVRLGFEPVFFETTLNGHAIRAVAFSRELYDSGQAERVTVVVGKTQASREGMVAQLWRPQLIRECIMLAFVAALIPLGLAVELRPLMKLRDDVAGRQPLQIEPMRAERLPQDVKLIVQAINQCIAQLRLNADRQRQFIADAAHQLRTPLSLLDAQLQYATHEDRDDAQAWMALTGARRTAEKMKKITAQLLMLAQAESMPRLTPRKTSLPTVVASVLEDLIVAAQRRNIDLGAEFNGNANVEGDSELLAALVLNLVDNAIRYTQEGGRVTAHVSDDGDKVVLRVIDNGPGISRDVRSRVFERFFRASTSADGTGLGLSIVREIARLHGGDAELGPGEAGAGLTVTVRLPAWKHVGKDDETAAGRG